MIDTGKLHSELAAVAPIDGVSIGDANNRATWRVDFRQDATDQQKDAAAQVIADFDAAPAPATFLARDLMSQFTAADYAAIQTEIASSAALGLLWTSLLAQGDVPIRTNAQRFQDGWAGLVAALGADRAAAIAVALGITV